MIRLVDIVAVLVFVGICTGANGAAIERRASPGCGKTHNFVGQTREFSFDSPKGGGTRTYRIHLPSNYNPRTAKPLMIAYHGHGNNPTKFEGQTRFSDESINPDMIVVYPKGIDGAWQGPTYARPGVSDKIFSTDLVNRIKNNYCVDESRIYATGHSNGGGFVNTLACSPEHGGQFAAFAPISGAFYTDVSGNVNCTPSRSPLPMFEVHGVADKTIPYNGTPKGKGGPLPSIPDWVNRWAKRNQCDRPQETDLGKGVRDIRYNCRGIPGALEISVWRIKDTGGQALSRRSTSHPGLLSS